nr:redoxin domain-containing protein [Pseudomonas sp. HS-2]
MNVRTKSARRKLGALLGFTLLSSWPYASASAQAAQPAFVPTLQKLGATPEEIAHILENYQGAPPSMRAKLEANDPDAVKQLLQYQRGISATENAHPLLTAGSAMPQFSLKGVDGKTYTPESFKGAKAVVVMFFSNHCPASQMVEARAKKMAADYASKGVMFVAIQPDAPSASSPSQHNYTDVEAVSYTHLDGYKRQPLIVA